MAQPPIDSKDPRLQGAGGFDDPPAKGAATTEVPLQAFQDCLHLGGIDGGGRFGRYHAPEPAAGAGELFILDQEMEPVASTALASINGHLAKVGARADLAPCKVLEKDIAFKAGTDWGVFLSHEV